MMTWKRLRGTGLLALLAAGLIGCGGVKPGKREAFTIAPTGYMIGTIDPCTCSNPLGGLARRSTMIADKVTNPRATLFVDAGNFISMHHSEGKERSTIMVAALKRLGVQAINLNLRDLRLGLPALKEMQKTYDLPFTSANIRDAETHQLAFDPYKLIRLQGENGPMTVAVIGVAKDAVGRYMAKSSKAEISSPPDGLRTALDAVKDHAACVVLLTDADQGTVAEWLNRIEATHEVSAVISSSLVPSHLVYSTIRHIPFTTTGRQGKFFDLARMTPRNDGSWKMAKQGWPLNTTVGDDPEMVAFIENMKAQWKVGGGQEPGEDE